MASTINPNNINGAYPVAGQDNDSQGFRDNFTNTKTNFGYAAAEITDLQNKAVLKSALAGTVLNNDMSGSILSNAQLQDMCETKITLGSVPGSIVLNYAAGSYFALSTSGAVSLSFSNFSIAGTTSRLRVQIQVTNVAHTVTLPAAVIYGISNVQGLSNNIISFNQTGFYEFEFETSDGGTNISIFDLNRNRDPIYLPSAQDLAPSTAASLTQTTSYFSTASAETATLAAGVAGQVKVLAMTANGGGDMVVTVTNAGWKTSGTGTVTFDTIGDACTLMYINNKWFCIGNNGATFA
jgi:hypothetical protein